MALRPAVFLDRDGTLNHQIIRDGKPFAASSLEEFRLFEGVPECCRALKAAGFLLVVVTNQPDVGRGTLPEAVVDAIHARLSELVPEIDRVEACYDPGRGEGSLRRKPEPGMILDAAKALGIDLSRSWMVGDRWRDVECGRRAGVKTVFIDFRYSEKFAFEPDYTVDTFPEAASLILRMAGGGASGVYSTCPIPNSDLNSEAQKPMKSLSDLRIHIYADGADKAGILDLYAKPYIKGLTTNPSLMKKAGIKDYEAFAKDILQTVKAKPISLEVFTDDFKTKENINAVDAIWRQHNDGKITADEARNQIWDYAARWHDEVARGVRNPADQRELFTAGVRGEPAEGAAGRGDRGGTPVVDQTPETPEVSIFAKPAPKAKGNISLEFLKGGLKKLGK